MRIPVSYGADRRKAESILLDCVNHETEAINELSEPAKRSLETRYGITLDDLTPRVFYRLTDNWLELTVRFIVQEHGIRQVKDAIGRAVLDAFERTGIGIASATIEIVGMPALRIVTENQRSTGSASGWRSGWRVHAAVARI